ncbi:MULTISPECIES: hypothetical protein [unclassified Paenibacillus]|uniref:hypothetical protein n=1 Tax=unclassified Paenibacillus TaxID=185978 RepID=UPI000956F6D8|nr:MULTISPECIES: hypothetical protein [unclassified Paenibacillus]QID16029.1 hypothetical protein CIC07_25185 [Paenibacillus sp. RUD330]SIR42457.1 hypothetical protein SAMN05880555_3758 [Paenibacillus sp. RU4X]SIR52537.1 hypothetical protein SAMN05880570_3760 [Paenibacillus sp. RU4T]
MMEEYFMEKMAELKQSEMRGENPIRMWEDIEKGPAAVRRPVKRRWHALAAFGALIRK